MVKNGDLIDVEPDGTITVAGKPIGGGGGGGGTDYTAGSNIEISEAKEIAVNPELTGIKTIKFAPSNEFEISKNNGGVLITKNSNSGMTLPKISLKNSEKNTSLGLSFAYDDAKYQSIVFSTTGYDGSEVYAFFTRSKKVPLVPSQEGTYLLKATVSSIGIVDYTWEKQQ